MARQLIWTERAQKERIEIFSFWNIRNKSVIYSKKLNEFIKESLALISKYPLIGRLTNKENVRVKVLKEYLIIYEITINEIVVLSIWDCRQNPEDLKRIME
ncbi:MAG: type II toxin-antitoxin system RelE/ParE family toxin [Prolixibacteraceae bacterium]|nr:type II toxin-antitoxin system RelE/ParE family toxin [Prolixibacteraceae bacterium]